MSDLKILKRPTHRDVTDFADDIARFRRVLEEAGYTASDNDLAWAWRDYSSDEWCAGWMGPDHIADEDVLEGIRSRLREEQPHE